MTEMDSSLSKSYWLMYCLSFKKSMRATTMMTKREKRRRAIPFLVPPHPSAIPEKMAERIAVAPATIHIFCWSSSVNDLRKPFAFGVGFLFLPNTLILRFKSLSSPMMPLFAYEAKSVMVYCTRSCKFYGLFLPG